MAFPAVLRSFRENPEARRLALIFAVVYFAQGMWYLPNLSLTFLLKEALHLSAGQTADFFAITIIPWLIKPVYGLLSDFVPLWLMLDSGVLYTPKGFKYLILNNFFQRCRVCRDPREKPVKTIFYDKVDQ
jgi:hypothetical protein